MSLTTSVFIAASLDGFIAREDDALDWLDAANATVPEGEDCGFFSFMASVDALVMGRNTYEKVLSLGQWPYENKPVIVLSSKKSISIPASLKETVRHSSESPQELYKRLSQEGLKRIYIDGGITIQRFLAANLIDDMTITVIPTLLGKGKRLFGDLEKDIQLRHTETKTYEFGFIQITYKVIKTA
ncbi:dihydrofolate reductase family protein [Desulfonema magnum]|uniref:Deaminase-reductase domain-containing protein n=1 Tax=Desulfonema magnum TaxID=45655 RepID=A0A975BI28_9BACT|nr:dihydrofolate reductase family protein [Desulfonema magnum]QTA86104.1 Deaminase-reductase domain-containing protein [Desulfonema magnum]